MCHYNWRIAHRRGEDGLQEIGNRMKEYEAVWDFKMTRRLPVIIRVDGKAFHSYTRGFEKPFDLRIVHAMTAAARALCEEIQGARLAYVQSDEISVLVVDYVSLRSEAWFGNRVQKQASIAASIATMAFNRAMADKPTAVFDGRVFQLPREEVCNYFIWRQLDAARNSITSVARAYFSHRQLYGKNTSEMQEMLFQAHGINWAKLPTWQKRGFCVVRKTYQKNGVIRHRWAADMQIPDFRKDRGYIERFVVPSVEEDAAPLSNG